MAESKDLLQARLVAAELVCLMYGWTGVKGDSPRDKALTELWQAWAALVPDNFLEPGNHPELSDEVIDQLAHRRDETISRTLASIQART